MPDFLVVPFADSPHVAPLSIFLRLFVAFALGSVVAVIYRRTRNNTQIAASFPTTLILLAIVIAMVTQVIGDSVARAFSLVGALSIVRFRTVVRDTQDTAFVIVAVVIGMAVGAQNLWIAAIGIAVVGCASFWTWACTNKSAEARPAFLLTLRLGLGTEAQHLGLDTYLECRELVSVGTAKQGVALEYIYETRLRPDFAPDQLVHTLNAIEGVQSAQIQRRTLEEI